MSWWFVVITILGAWGAIGYIAVRSKLRAEKRLEDWQKDAVNWYPKEEDYIPPPFWFGDPPDGDTFP